MLDPLEPKSLFGCVATSLVATAVMMCGVYFAFLGLVIEALPAGREEAWQWVMGESAAIRSALPGGPSGWPARGIITSHFQDPFYQQRFGRVHQGVDIASGLGNPVTATLSGEVVYAGQLDRWGNLVIVRSGDFEAFYAHLDSVTVNSGSHVLAGHTIGTLGQTGNAFGVHLHYEVHYRGSPVDPLAYIRAPSD